MEVNGKTLVMDAEVEDGTVIETIESDETDEWNGLEPEEKEEVDNAIRGELE